MLIPIAVIINYGGMLVSFLILKDIEGAIFFGFSTIAILLAHISKKIH
jgi:hypothetical protein